MNLVDSMMMGSTRVLNAFVASTAVAALSRTHSFGKCFGWANWMMELWVAVDLVR